MADEELSALRKFFFIFSYVDSLRMIAMDVGTVVVYWKYKDIWIDGYAFAIASIIFLCLGGIGFIGHVIFAIIKRDAGLTAWIHKIMKGRKKHRMFQAATQCLPPLWIALFVLATQLNRSQYETVFLYAYAVLCYISLCAALPIFVRAFEEADQDAISCRENWHSVMLYVSKYVAIVVRVLILVYMTVQIGWWVTLAISVRVFITTIVVFRHLYASGDGLSQILINIAISILCGVFTVFSWFGTDKDAPIKDLVIMVFYTVENAAGLLASWFQDPRKDYHIHGHVLPVYFSLNALALVLLVAIIAFKKYASTKQTRSVPTATIQ